MSTFELYFGPKLGKLLYFLTDKFPQTLQSEKMAALISKRSAMLTIETISSMKNEENYNTMYNFCLKKIKSFTSSKILF